MDFVNRDILSIRDIAKDDILRVLQAAGELKQKPHPSLLHGKILGSCFFEPSTRTRLSFESAMLRLGGTVTGFADPSVTSVKKHETLHDTMKIIGQYVDVIAIRHSLDGAARLAAEATETPVVNCGDGSNQHPTQTLLDLFTIQETQGTLEGLSIAMVGDLKYGRTVHSLAEALTHFGARLFFVAPPELQMPGHIVKELETHGTVCSFHESLEEILPEIDILYMTRIQEERFSDKWEYERLKDSVGLRLRHLERAKQSMRVLHPLPRVNEIERAIDGTTFATYFEQAKNGLFVREAVLGLVLGVL